ncbi:hypothetical protein [Streptomyces sp. NPDC056061]|uniref:hypothetical protein n=1 Tax=Streptomyces sp. NPDC056061 TaxID=3345700 RepID=UPI0035DAE2AB
MGNGARHRWWWRSACALVVLVVVGFSVRAPVKDWWLAREACGGKLPQGDLRTVRTDARLGTERESFDLDSGQYHCVLKDERDKVVVAVDTYPEGWERDRKLSSVGSAHPPHAVLPGGLPGFEDENSLVHLMPECPRDGDGPSGKPRRLLVSTWTYFAKTREEKAAMLRLAVRMTNEVTGKLGCGGEPLPAPEDGAVPDTGAYVPRAKAKGTACNALATTRVPEEGRDGQVRIAIADGGVVGRCTLYAPKTDADDAYRRKSRTGRPLVELTHWRGDWAPGIREFGSGPGPLPLGRGADWKPALTEDRAWAVATCDGENVGFAAHWGYDYRPQRETGEKYEPPTAAERKEQRVLLREYVAAFANDRVRRGNCADLKLPAKP